MRRGRRGFTFVELLVVMIVIGLLAGLGILKYMDLKHRAMSAQAVADLEAIRLAGYSAWYETGAWPGEAGAGIVPPALKPYLSGSFAFVKPEYTLDWENFVPPGGGPSGGAPTSTAADQHRLGDRADHPELSVGDCGVLWL